MNKIVLFLFLLITFIGISQSIVRGPYMQSPTHESIKIMWRTSSSTSSKVWYGTDSTNLNLTAEINDNVTDHIVLLSNLDDSTTYFYQVGNLNGVLTTSISNHYFKTHPTPGTSVPVRVWAIGDFGRNNNGQIEVKQSYENWTGSRGTDVWLWLGDNAYSDGSDDEYQSKVFNVNGFSDVFSHLPFCPSPGNHDYNSVWEESTLLGIPYTNIALSSHTGPYFDIVEVPKYGEAGGYPSQHEVFYSFDYGDVHFLSLNSEVFDYTLSYDGINQMIDWIEADLQQNTAKFTIAYFHQPPYSKGSHDSDDAYELVMKAMREKVIPVLESYDVDLVVNGHSHVFERSYLIKGHTGDSDSFNSSMLMDGSNGQIDQGTPYIKDGSNATAEGTVYVVCGNSGSSETSPSLNHPVMVYTDGGSSAYGSFVIDVYKNRLDGRYLKYDGTVDDHFTILKQDLEINTLNNVNICEGDSVAIEALFTGGSDSLSFSWLPALDTNQTAILSPLSTTQYTLQITDLLTGQSESTTFQVGVESNTTPVITEVIQGTLGVTACSSCTYQWYINGNPINGANWNYYSPSFDGNYTCEVINDNGCANVSDEFIYTVLSTQSNSSMSLQLFPNPASELIHLVIPNYLIDQPFEVLNYQGQLLMQGQLNKSESNINIKQLPTGNYFIQWTLPNGNQEKLKFTKQ